MAITRIATSSLKTLNKYDSFLGGNAAFNPASYESIATISAGGTATATFSSIPSTYKHLQIRYIARDARAVSFTSVNYTFNGDTGNNYYRYHYLAGNGSTASAGAGGTYTSMSGGDLTGSSAGSNIFGAGIFDILDYQNTNKYKTTRILSGADLNGSGQVDLWSALWMSTAAISSITLVGSTGANFATGTQFALYGIKG